MANDALRALIAEKRAQQQQTVDFKRLKEATYASDLVPDRQYEHSEEEDQIDQVLKRLGIVEAYTKWCGKMRPKRRGTQTEGVMISCPVPGHRDDNPSAWANTEKNTWFCGGCNTGGDIYTIASYRLGHDTNGRDFHELRRAMMKDLGHSIIKGAGKQPDRVYVPELVTAPPPETLSEQPVIEVVEVEPEMPDFDLDDIFISNLDWRDIVPEDTFIRTYVNSCSYDDAPEEYHFWNAMTATGLAVGRSVTLADLTPVYANLLLCLLGKSGERKSRSVRHLSTVLKMAVPFDSKLDFPTGVLHTPTPGSGEMLVSFFVKAAKDPSDLSGKLTVPAPIRGLVRFDELQSLVSRAERNGSTLKPVILEFSDANTEVAMGTRTHGVESAFQPFASIVTTTQPDRLKDLITDGDMVDGFLNRWLFAAGTSKVKHPLGTPVDLTEAAYQLQLIHAQRARTLRFNAKSLKLWAEYFHDQIIPSQDKNPILTRLDLLQKKIILLLAINSELDEISEDVVRRTILLHEYLIGTYNFTAIKTRPDSLNTQIYDEIRRQIKHLSEKIAAPKGPTKNRILDNLRRKQWDPLLIDNIFKRLVDVDDNIDVIESPKDQRGRPATYYRWVG